MNKKTFKLSTLGCRTNQYETQAYRDQLLALGYREASEKEGAELCIINTCAVTEGADSSSRGQIRSLIKQNPHARVVATGCLVERRPDLVREIEGVSAVVSNKNKERPISFLFPEEDPPEFSIRQFEAHTRAFVKVQDGCNSFCTYCIIPYVRGRSRSRSISEVIKEVEGLVASGYKEVVVTGINVGDFDGAGEEKCLADLIQAIDQVKGLKRLRLSSIDPDEVDEKLASVILEGKTTCHSMHLVLQSGSNVILKRMNRKYTRQVFLNTVESLREKDSDFTFTTDVIVGFPGETEKDFEETLEVIDSVKFAKVHFFPFSPRERTRAFLFPNRLSPEAMKERKYALSHSAEQAAFRWRESFVGREMTVLTESSEGECAEGHTDNFLFVKILSRSPANELLRVRLIENTPEGLIGVPQ